MSIPGQLPRNGLLHAQSWRHLVDAWILTITACELLGLDPLYVANEGRFAAFLPESQAERALDVLHRFGVSSRAVRAGWVEQANSGTVVLRSRAGGNRVLDMLSGEQLPRIC